MLTREVVQEGCDLVSSFGFMCFRDLVWAEHELDELYEARLVVRDLGDRRWWSQDGHRDIGLRAEGRGQAPGFVDRHIRVDGQALARSRNLDELCEDIHIATPSCHSERGGVA